MLFSIDFFFFSFLSGLFGCPTKDRSVCPLNCFALQKKGVSSSLKRKSRGGHRCGERREVMRCMIEVRKPSNVEADGGEGQHLDATSLSLNKTPPPS